MHRHLFLSFTTTRVALHLNTTSSCAILERSPTFLQLLILPNRRPGTAIEDIRQRICWRGSNGPARCTAYRGIWVCLELHFERRGLFEMCRCWYVVESYESLPPNFSLLQNMVAGAFAGIAVSQTIDVQGISRGRNINGRVGTYCYVSHWCNQSLSRRPHL
jgi:hypothetical protein